MTTKLAPEGATTGARAQVAERVFRAHEQDWRNLAGRSFRRWRLPASIEYEDVLQELRLEAWLRLQSPDDSPACTQLAADERRQKAFDPARWVDGESGADEALFRYARWNGVVAANRMLNKARKAKRHRRDYFNPSRHEVAASSLVRAGEEPELAEERIFGRLTDEPVGTSRIEAAEAALELLEVARDEDEAHIALSLVDAGGDLGECALRLYVEDKESYRWKFTNEDAAERHVRGAVLAMAGRLAERRV